MTEFFSLSATRPIRDDRIARAWLFAAWLVLAGYFIATHVMWRDEVRAFTFALRGASIPNMLWEIHGEGHPALWYLLLRIAHDMVPVREVLPAMAALLGAAAAALLAFRAPFRPLVLALALFGEWMVFEYTAVARNYGMSALLMFALADRWSPRSARPLLPGLLLFLLCNTNVPSLMLAGCLLLFWLVELVSTDGWRWTPAIRGWCIAAGCVALGAVTCVAVVYPPYNDASVSPALHQLSVGSVLLAAVNWVDPLFNLLPYYLWQWRPLTDWMLLAMLIAVPVSLIRTPGGFVAGLVAMLAFILFFQLIYPGAYRHVSLLLAFAVTLHWLVAKGHGGRWPARWQQRATTMASVGAAGFALLLAMQVSFAAVQLDYIARGGVYGRAADLGRLLQRPDLRRAVVMANPDVMVEALAYYAPNPTWLVREGKFGRTVRFTFFRDRDLSLARFLDIARRLKRATGRPVVMALRQHLDPRRPRQIGDEGYRITFSTTPAQVRTFAAATTPIARFGDSQLDEDYDVYLLR